MSVINQGKLESYLKQKLEAEDLSIANVWKNLEGWSMETYSIGLSYVKDGRPVKREIIIRKAPEAGLMAENYDVSIEYRVLTALNKTKMAVPRTLWIEENPEVMGRPFYVMEKVEGSVPFPPAVSFDPTYRLFSDDKERLSIADDFIKNLAYLHNVDWRPLGLDFLGVPERGTGSAMMQVRYWEDRITRAGFRDKPVIAYTVAWLKNNLVENDRICIVHGDYRSGNYITRDKRIAAILDWELVHLGDPLGDIAYVLNAWRDGPPLRWVSYLLPEEEFLERYEDASGIKIDKEKLEFYQMLFRFKWLGLTITAAGAFRKHQKLDLKIGVFGMMHYVALFELTNELNRRHIAHKGVK